MAEGEYLWLKGGIITIEGHKKREAGERSSGHDQPAINKDLEERYINFMAEGDQMRAVEALGTNCPPAKIQKVIFLLRDHKHFIKHFEPRVASLGPIHHDNTKYQLGEKYKLKLAYEFAKRCGKGMNLLCEVKSKIKQLRECFEEEVTKKYDDEALAWMLFVDGCAILQFIFCFVNHKFKELNMKNDSILAFAQQDLFLLENQVPFGLLKLLMSEKEAELNESIQSFIQNVTYQQTEPKQKPTETVPTHLLDLLRTRLLGPPESSGESSHSQPKQKLIETGLTHLLVLMRKLWGGCHTFFGMRRRKMTMLRQSIHKGPLPSSKPPPLSGKTGREDPDWQSYRNVQELKAAGIHLKRAKNNSYLRNISFTRHLGSYPGYLWLPLIIVDDSTGTRFKNLIAYEMCMDFENDFGVTSYISFLDSLIDETNDVKDLRKARVLYNFVGSDQEVADLFNEIGTDLVPNTEAYKDVKLQIQGYYQSRCMTWMAQFVHDHFNSPWTILAFLGVLLGLALTALQTWSAIFPHSFDNAKN